jgi:deazaflavin-dependent oxidoreductase (nitroreductase family)
MDDTIRTALDHNQVIDITTTGRRSGEPRRIEIFMHSIDGRIVISGMPRASHTRAWIHNLQANPNLTIHFKGPFAQGDVAATGRIVTEPLERRHLLEGVARNWKRTDVDEMVAHSPLIEVTVPGYDRAA